MKLCGTGIPSKPKAGYALSGAIPCFCVIAKSQNLADLKIKVLSARTGSQPQPKSKRGHLSHKTLIRQMLSVNNTAKGVSENVGVLTVAIPPFQFVQVPVNVLGADLVECSNDASLE